MKRSEPVGGTAPWRGTLLVARKELRSSLRDRQTVLYAIVLPIALYPVLLWLLVQGALVAQGRDEQSTPQVVLASAAPEALPPGLEATLAAAPPGSGADPALEVVPAGAGLTRDAARALLAGDGGGPDAVLWVPAPAPASGEASAGAVSLERARLFHDSTRRASRLAVERLGTRLEPFALDLRAEAVATRGGNPGELVPFEVESHNVAPGRDMLAYTLAFLLPLLLVVMCVMGAFFPAVDLTAGERERSTAETTLLIPLPRLAVHQGKILAVTCSAVLATTLNLSALGLSVGHLLDLMTGGALGLAGFPVVALASVAPLALLFSFFVSAVLVGIASLARGFEEGQALLGPVQILFIVPALVGVIPGIELTPALGLVPVVNVALAFRGLLLGAMQPLEYGIVALSLVAYGAVAMHLAVRLLERERKRGSRDARAEEVSLAVR